MKKMKNDIIIGSESYCDFHKIQEGFDYLQQLPEIMEKKMTILAGDYQENVSCYASNVKIFGLGKVIIKGNLSAELLDEAGKALTTFRTATFFIEAKNVELNNLVIINDAGPGELVGQAVALFNFGHQTKLVDCSLSGYQDTLCTGPLPPTQKDGSPFCTPKLLKKYSYCYQEYENCFIEGTIDFIFGGAQAIFRNCELRSRARDGSEGGFITAASTPESQKTGFIFDECYLSAEKGVEQIYLGRPWRSYAKTSFENCFIGAHIIAIGWNDWDNPKNRETVMYQEKNNSYAGQFKRDEWINFEK